MAATRNKNTYCDYLIEQSSKNSIHQHLLYKNSSNGRAYTSTVDIPSIGYMPSYMPADVLSNNSIDIESRLFGIGSCNLVKPLPDITPDINKIQPKKYFDHSNMIQIPPQLTIKTDQRPYIP